jgi:hypothetical protein
MDNLQDSASLAGARCAASCDTGEPGSPGADGGEPCSGLEFVPVSLAQRSDGWTPKRQRAFIKALAETGIVREAAARVQMTERSAYRLRQRPDAASFCRAWSAAMNMGAERLRSLAYDRAVNGTLRRRYYHGKLVGEERVYDNRLLAYLVGKTAMSEPKNPEPASDRNAPFWRGDDGQWHTNFPPPTGFRGIQRGSFGDADYSRHLSEEEQASVEASPHGGGEAGTATGGKSIRVIFV